MLERGVPAPMVAKLLQHKTFDTTQRHYLSDDARKTSDAGEE
jgi:integrase